MAIVINHAPKWASALTAGGQGYLQGVKAKDEHDAYRARVAQATQELAIQAAQEQRAKEDQQFQRADQAARSKLQDQAIQRGQQEIDDRNSAAQADPFTVALSDPNVTPAGKAELARGQLIYGKMHGTGFAKQFAIESLHQAKKADLLTHLTELKTRTQDGLALQQYGEDQKVQESAGKIAQGVDEILAKIKDPTMDVSHAVALLQGGYDRLSHEETGLRHTLTRATDKQLEHQQALAYAESVMGAIQPGTPGAEKARHALAALQHGVITPQKAYEELEVAQRPETNAPSTAPKPISKIEIRKTAHQLATQEAAALGVQKMLPDDFAAMGVKNAHELFQQLVDKYMVQLVGDQLENSPQALDPMQPLQTQAGRREAQSLQPQNGQAAAPSSAGSLPANQSSVTAGGGSAPSKPVDQATAIQAFQVAQRMGASDEELKTILRNAGIDPDAPAPVPPLADSGPSATDAKPKRKRRDAIVKEDPLLTPKLKE